MNNAHIPLTQDLVLVGGGHTHALVLRTWGMNPLPGVRVTLINPGPTAPYTGMLPGFVAGHYDRTTLDIDLVRLARFAGARVIFGAVDKIDRDAKMMCVGKRKVAYDVASIDIGITSDMPEIKGFVQWGVPAKPLGVFAQNWGAFRDQTGPAQICVIGGGVAGVELAMAMKHAKGALAVVRIVDRSEVLAGVGDRARKALLEQLDDAGIEWIEGQGVDEVTQESVTLAGGRILPSQFTVGVAGARPYGWLSETGRELLNGYIAVDQSLKTSDPAIFSAGDCAHLNHAPRPKAGVFAVRAAPVLLHNLRASLSGQKLKPFHPQKHYLKLISLGGKSALAEKFGLALRGPLLWKWKDRIDRAFMDKFQDYPEMDARLPREVALGVQEEVSAAATLCGGCGAKVGRGVLADVIGAMPATARNDVIQASGDDAAVLIHGDGRQVLTTDHLRAFWDDPAVMARIAAIHALGDIWAMGAAPQAATANLVLPRMSAPLQKRWMDEIMRAAGEVFTEAGAAIVGGHSALGAETIIGFSVTGLCSGTPIGLAGAKAGDALILTKPIGTGVIMAAEMARKASGVVIEAALAQMQKPQGAAAEILAGAHAMTDVTGFGLAGHLLGICEASGCGAELRLAEVPVLEGAEALAATGLRSSLYRDNAIIREGMEIPESPRADLLFDPQTAGGLLAAVDDKSAKQALTLLKKAGFDARLIGSITNDVGRIRVS
jgi:selenide,water dikinase